MKTLEDVGEVGIVKWLIETFPTESPDIILGNGHDAAVVSIPDKVALKTDTLVVSEMLSGVGYSDVGWKAIVACISDLAAIGAKPLFCTLSFSSPRSLRFSRFKQIFMGVKEALTYCKTRFVGGDLSESHDIVITVNVAGSAPNPVPRTGGKPGDYIAVSRPFGLEPLGLRHLLGKITLDENLAKLSTSSFLRPVPEVDYGQRLASLAGVHACTDSSDSLSISLSNMLGGKLDAHLIRLPAHPSIEGLGPGVVEDLVLNGGEEYALVYAYDPRYDRALVKSLSKIRRSRMVIGRLSEGRGRIFVRTPAGEKIVIPAGWRQFQSR